MKPDNNTAPKKEKSQDKPKRPPFHIEFAEKIIDRLKEGTAPWQRPWHPGKTLMVPHNPASGTVYRGMNRVNLSLSDFEDPRWMTLKQANEQGLSILPGSKSTPVVYFQFSKEEDRLGEDGKPILGEDGNPLKDKVELDKPIVRFAHVFNAEQIDGMPQLELTDKAYSWDPVDKAENILAASGANINHDQSDRAFYRYFTDSIHLPPRENFEDPGKYYGTALHELGHWTRHETRLNRENGPFGSEMYAREELRAEIASWMLGQDIGIPHDPGQHAAYVASWIKSLEDDPYEIVRACRDAEQIKEYVLGLERRKEVELEQPEKQPEKMPEKTARRERETGIAGDIAAMGVPAEPAKEKTWLQVPYREKEQAKRLGARWDKDEKSWYAPEGADLAKLASWVPEKERQERFITVISPVDEFAAALEKAGLDLGGRSPLMDGKIHRVPLIDGKPGALDGAYCGYSDDHLAGWMQNFHTGEKTKWVSTGHVLTKEQYAALSANMDKQREEREQALRESRNQAARDAYTEWVGHDWATDNNAYLQRKDVQALGVREDLDGNLLVPVRNAEGDLRGLQTITESGLKRFSPGMEKTGNFHMISEPGKDLSQGEIMLAEGYATGASLHMATGKPVAVAFDAGNLEPVARALREKYPNAAITICADNDHQHKRGGELWNKGVAMAQDAAKAVGGKVVAPIFNEEERARGLTDFNDLHQSRGLEEVKKQLGLVLQQDQEKFREKGKTRELAL